MQTSVIHQPPKPVDPKAESVVEIKDLYKSFGSNHVLRGFNLNLKKGENLVVLGKSGSGKSVLIKCMVGLLTVYSWTYFANSMMQVLCRSNVFRFGQSRCC